MKSSMNSKGLWRVFSLLVVTVLVFSLAGCGKNSTKDGKDSTGSSDSHVKITVTNGKAEINSQFEQAVKDFMAANKDIEVELHTGAVGDTISQFDKLTASGIVVTIGMFEPYSALTKYKDVEIDLSKEKWNEETNDALKNKDGQVVGFPFAIEGMGLVYNKSVVEKAVGGNFDPFSINTRDKLIALLDKIKESGVKFPIAYQTEAWSVGNHYSSLFLDQENDPNVMVDKIANGEVKLADNAVWNGYYDTMDLLASKKYNMYGERPLDQYYDAAHVAVGKGEAAILFNGDWAYDSLKAVEKDNFGFMPVPVDNNPDNPANNKIAVGPTQVLAINKNATAQQQEAAKKFLNWLVYDEKGQDFLVNKSQVISAFKNNPNKVSNPLGVAITDAISKGKTMPFSTNYIDSSKWSTEIGPKVQQYIGGKLTRKQLADVLETYFKSTK